MAIFQSQENLLLVLAIGFSAVWGLACGACERILLAPHRRLSSLGPAYVPAMILAFLAGCYFLFGDEKVRFFFAILMAGIFFVIGALPALAVFHLSRYLFRTHFTDKTNR